MARKSILCHLCVCGVLYFICSLMHAFVWCFHLTLGIMFSNKHSKNSNIVKYYYNLKYLFSLHLNVLNHFFLWRDIQPSMVTHTLNSCSAFNPSKVHTHNSEHTPRAVGSHLCRGARGVVGGSVLCSRAPQSWYWRWRECWTFTPLTYNSFRPETRTRSLWINSELD